MLPEAPERLGGKGGRKLPYWMSVPGQDNLRLLELPRDRVDVNNWDPDSTQLTGAPSGEYFPSETPDFPSPPKSEKKMIMIRS